MRALVIGASGFVGRHLVTHLESCGDDVVASDRASGGPDICDAAAMVDHVADAAPHVVYHLAGQSDVARSWVDVETTFRTNVQGLLNVLAACREASVAKVVAIISADVYGHVRPDQLPLDEDTPMRPVSPYGASKVAADYVALQAHLGYGMDVVRARPFTHIGPGQSERFVASALASRIARAELEGRDDITVGSLDTRRDFTDVRDVVRAYRLLAQHGHAGEVYNICTGVDISIQDLADTLVSLSTRPVRLVPDPALLRPADLAVLRGDATRIHQLTGWKPEIPLSGTLADLLDDWRRRVRAGE
jgi:GDP-4-dehydro-6-deoxy-D-mannose reductase